MKIKEVSYSAEQLIEVGAAAQEQKKQMQIGLQSAQQRVYQAQYHLERASATDENGQPMGDVSSAQLELEEAQLDAQYYQEQIAELEREIEEINAQKLDTIHILDDYVAGESGNLSKAQLAESKAFGGNAAALAAVLAAGISLAEHTRQALYQSMGMNASGSGMGGFAGAVGAVSPQAAVMQTGEAWADSLSGEERSAISAYTGTAYANINAVLRGIDSRFTEGNHQRAKNIHSALSRARLPADCVVHRGTSRAALGRLADMPDQALVGHVISDDGFMSTSLKKEDAFGGEVQLEIHAPKGSRAAYVGSISQLGHHESEVLFDCGQDMRITGVRRDTFGRRTIQVQIVNGGENR